LLDSTGNKLAFVELYNGLVPIRPAFYLVILRNQQGSWLEQKTKIFPKKIASSVVIVPKESFF